MELSPIVTVAIANGGYVLMGRARPEEPSEDPVIDFSVFSDIDVALAYAKRVVLSWEGPGELAPGDRIGPLKVAE